MKHSALLATAWVQAFPQTVLVSRATCDPRAVHAAKTCAKDELVLSTRQENILRLLKAALAGLTAEELAARAGISRQELERDFATLRHMEKARAQKRADGRKVLVAWQAGQETT